MKCRVFKKEDGAVIISWPSKEYQEKMDECKYPDFTKGLPFADLAPDDRSYKIVIDEKVPIEQMHFDGPTHKSHLKVDHNWEHQLMSPQMIKKLHADKLNSELDTELERDTRDIGKIAALMREKEKSSAYTDDQLYALALNNLGGKKPEVIAKLKKKLGA